MSARFAARSSRTCHKWRSSSLSALVPTAQLTAQIIPDRTRSHFLAHIWSLHERPCGHDHRPAGPLTAAPTEQVVVPARVASCSEVAFRPVGARRGLLHERAQNVA